MRGLIFYTFEDAEKNKWFIRRMQEEGARRGHLLSLYIVDRPAPDVQDCPADFCINRSRLPSISQCFEEKQKCSVNNEKTIRIANDKWLTYKLFKKLALPCMDTFLPDHLPPFPFVVKGRGGHGGSEVFLVKNEAEYKALLPRLQDTPYLLQPLCDEPGVDVRVYVMGENVMAAVKRTSESDFRSNYSLGGQVELFQPTQEQLSCIRRLQKALNSDYIGVDFIRHKGQWVLNEIEDAAGARMLYQLTKIDFISHYWQQIERRLKGE